MRVLAIILAGGASENLSVLTAVRAEPAIPFGGKFRIIDFPLSNCVNSNIYDVALLTQHMPRSLNAHVGVGKPWDLDRSQGGVRLLQPYLGPRQSGWQRGNADAVRRNLDFVDERRADTVLLLAGDHIYKMDYRQMLQFHESKQADVTLGVRRVSPFETYRFGIVSVEPNMQVTGFKEKPRRSKETLASMGIYVFKVDVLRDALADDKTNDFGRDVLPRIISSYKAYAYTFEGYWADVGTLQAYWEANMALLAETPALDLYDPEWVIHTKSEEQPPVQIGEQAWAGGNLISNGCIVEGVVERSVLSPGVRIEPGAIVRDSVIMNDTVVKPSARVERAIVDKSVVVGEGAEIGYGVDNTPNKLHPNRLNTGLTAVGKWAHIPPGVKIGHNVIISPGVRETDFPADYVNSGETI
ncbi:MAG TPA: glucose-1-phosphate adenylyltransferase subunit GlgD [Anaerolineae bacterium]|nr:glucose-1-phosphate adenylyltransferase subunit GlgD [Anaerolineae bacterium]HMR64498.1 glucose-1-phosphate adenylyltransferase subunit GlgD [Anaerolineae bacterium]